MPLYEYSCRECGPFGLIRKVSESGEPAGCPQCGEVALKVFPLINLRSMRPGNRQAWERNERSQHAPHVCGSGCSHTKPRAKKATKNGDRPALQMSTKQNRRPWMLGH